MRLPQPTPVNDPSTLMSAYSRFKKYSAPGLRFGLIIGLSLYLAACGAGRLKPLPEPTTLTLDPSVTVLTTEPLQPAEKIDDGKVQIALLLPFSGTGGLDRIAAALGNATELALFDFHKSDIILIIKDTKGTPEGARTAVTAALNEGAEIILGPLLASSLKAISAITYPRDIPVISFSTDSTVAGNRTYLLSFLPEQDVERVVDYAILRGAVRFAALTPQSGYGRVVEQAFTQAVQSRAGSILSLSRFERSPTALQPAVEKLARDLGVTITPEGTGTSDLDVPITPESIGTSVDFSQDVSAVDALLIAEGGALLKTIGPILTYHELDTHEIQLLGTGLWDNASLSKQKPLIGGWFAAPSPKQRAAFATRFEKTFGYQPPRIASLAYDAMSLTIALSRTPMDQRFSHEILTSPDGFNGVDGLFRFMPDGLNQRGLAIIELTRTGLKVIDPAPLKFDQTFTSQATPSLEQPFAPLPDEQTSQPRALSEDLQSF